jgi:hypothetical protein
MNPLVVGKTNSVRIKQIVECAVTKWTWNYPRADIKKYIALGKSVTILVDVLGKNIGNQSGEAISGGFHIILSLNGAKNLITKNLIVIGGEPIK